MYARLVLPRPGRPDEQDVVERLVARLRRLQRDRELVLDPRLPDEVAEPPRAQRLLELFLLGHDGRREKLGAHYAAFSASRTRSSGGSSGFVRARAISASPTE